VGAIFVGSDEQILSSLVKLPALYLITLIV
jgi:hypothetical protein